MTPRDISAVPDAANSYSISPDAGLLREASLRELMVAKVVTAITAVGGLGGFIVVVMFGERMGVLATSRGGARGIASLSTLATLLQRLGCSRFDVDVSGYQRGRVRAAQPARSAAMKAGQLPRAPKSKKATPKKSSEAKASKD